jgi:membrane protease YdiL (CAAX protease family)
VNTTTQSRRVNVWGFFAATYAVSWLIWLTPILQHTEQPNLLMVALGAFVPSTMGILFTYLSCRKEGRQDFWRRVIDVRRINWRWLIVILLIFPLAHALTYPLYTIIGGTPPSLTDLLKNISTPGLVLQVILANLVISGFSEELGWRGYALDQLQHKRGALSASLILGLIHGFWHLPLFFIPGITQGETGLFSLGALVFLAGGPIGSVVFTWIYNNTRRSILGAILVHFMINLCLDLLTGLQGALPTGYSAVYLGVLLLFDLVIVAVWGTSTMKGRHKADISLPISPHTEPKTAVEGK